MFLNKTDYQILIDAVSHAAQQHHHRCPQCRRPDGISPRCTCHCAEAHNARLVLMRNSIPSTKLPTAELIVEMMGPIANGVFSTLHTLAVEYLRTESTDGLQVAAAYLGASLFAISHELNWTQQMAFLAVMTQPSTAFEPVDAGVTSIYVNPMGNRVTWKELIAEDLLKRMEDHVRQSIQALRKQAAEEKYDT